MPFLILFFLVVTALPLPWWPSLLGWGLPGSILATVALIGLPVLGAAGLARRTRRRLLHEPDHREAVLRAYSRGRLLNLVALMTGHALALTVFGWGWAVRAVFGAETPNDLPFGAELVLMAPFLIGLVLSWACLYSAERTACETSSLGPTRPFGGRWGYVVFLARQHLAIAGVPLALFVTQQGLVRSLPDWFKSDWARLALFVPVILFLVLAPWLLRPILGARSLPAGPLRDRLEAAACRLRFRCSDLLLWDTRGGVVNAMVAGPLPWVRYVFLSDRLLDELTPDEVEAVFGHEAGHVRHGHLLYYIAFMFLSLTLLVGLWDVVLQLILSQFSSDTTAALSAWGNWELAPAVLLIGAYVFVVFGFLSRRCERQADVYGCRAVSCAETACAGHGPDTPLAPAGRGLCPTGIRIFISALNKVADLNGISRRKPGWLQAWLHASIGRRVDFLEQLLTDRALEARFQRRLGLLKWSLLVGLAAALVTLGLSGYGDAVWTAL